MKKENPNSLSNLYWNSERLLPLCLLANAITWKTEILILNTWGILD
jgi:hypothetical protein